MPTIVTHSSWPLHGLQQLLLKRDTDPTASCLRQMREKSVEEVFGVLLWGEAV